MAEDSTLTQQQLISLRRVTAGVSDELEKELAGYLETLAQVLRPKRLLGNLIGSESTDVPLNPEKSFDELQDLYKKVVEPRPLRLKPTLSKPLANINVRLEIYPWEDVWEPPEGGRRLAVVSPFAWTVTYPGACSLRELRRMLGGEEARDDAKIQQFALNACILRMLIEQTAGFTKILSGLRYVVETRYARDLGEVPIPVIRSALQSVRPAPQLMIDMAAMVGADSFEEVIDANAADSLEDPLRARLKKHSG